MKRAAWGRARGPIAWMAGNSVAANLLMLFLLVGGLIGPKPHHRPHMGGHHAAAGTYHTHR